MWELMFPLKKASSPLTVLSMWPMRFQWYMGWFPAVLLFVVRCGGGVSVVFDLDRGDL